MSVDNFEVIVIGAGVEGSSSAYHLAKCGQKTLLLEQFPLPHSRGSSHGQSRITRYAYAQDYYVQMMCDAFLLWDILAKEVGVELYKQCGLLNLGLNKGESLSSIASAMTRHGMEFKSVSHSELTQRFPMLSYPSSYAGILDPRGGILRADKALAAFQTMFKRFGGLLRDGEPVTNIIPGQNLVTVVTTKGQYSAKKIVLAPGPWASKLLRPLGLNLPFKPVRITVCYFRENRDMAYSSDRFPCLIDEQHFYALPSDEYPGYVKVCLHTGPEIDPDARDSVDDSWVRQSITQYVCTHLPWLQGSPGITETCIYTNTPDEDPVIDYHPKRKNIVIAAGFSGHGFKLAPAVGNAVAELVLEKPPSYDMAHFSIARFTQPSSNL